MSAATTPVGRRLPRPAWPLPARVRSAAAGWPVSALALASLLVAGWHVDGIEEPSVGIPRLLLLGAAASAPSLLAAASAPSRRFAVHAAASVVLAVVALGLVLGHWPLRPHLLGETGYFGRVGSDLADGGREWPRVLLPYSVARFPELNRAFTVALLVLLWAIASAVVLLRRPLLAALLVFLPFAAGSAVYHLKAQSARGAAMLLLTIALLYVLRRDRPPPSGGRAGVVASSTLGLALLAVGAAHLPGVSKDPALGWRQWELGVARGTSVSFVWDQTYGPLVRPGQAKRLLQVKAPLASYWRATTLDTFDGVGWVADLDLGAASTDRAVAAPDGGPVQGGATYRATFKNVGLDEPYLLTAEHPVAVGDVPGSAGSVAVSTTSVFRTSQSAAVGSSWSSTNRSLKIDSAVLSAAGSAYPEPVTAGLVVAGKSFPAWGTKGRDPAARAILARSFLDPRLADWSKVYATLSRIVAGARTPYAATVLVEAYFQQNYHYDEKANYASAPRGPLPTFFLSADRNGYCQMFSGTMAVALRLLGIPARVTEGFTPGAFSERSKSFVVTDRDAHAWVEVYFPGHGWLPFEPTPSRRLPEAYSSTSPSFTTDLSKIAKASPDTSGLKDLVKRFGGQSAAAAAAAGVRFGDRPGCGGRSAQACKAQEAAASARSTGVESRTGSPGVGTIAAGVVALCALLLLAWKALRDRLAYLRRGGDAVASAVLSDLRAYLADQGVARARRARTPRELASIIDDVYGIDATAWSTAQTRARYGPPTSRVAAAGASRTEAARLKERLRETISNGGRMRGLWSTASLRR